nr:CDP-glycerol glycerophosphotransferase family protein [Lachnospiraceae bacterium]
MKKKSIKKQCKEKIKFVGKRLSCWYYRNFKPVQENKIVFSQFAGQGYGCNPRAICDEFLKRDAGYDLVWILNKKIKREDAGIPEGVRTVTGKEVYYELETAKVWINNIHFNVLMYEGVVKRKDTIYLNTFHGGITLKNQVTDKKTYDPKIEKMRKERMYHRDAEFVDYITCGCDMEIHVLEEFFYHNGEILKLGDARTDMLVNGAPEIEKKVRDFYHIPDGTKVAIYAPTFRADKKLDCYNLEFDRILDYLEKRDGCPWIMLIRLHPRLAKQTDKIVPKSPRYINAANYTDMQELAVASDFMISDYSSVITDFMLTRKPGFMYVPDLDHYLEARGMYFEMEELPFPYARTNDEFMEKLEQFDETLYREKVDAFVKKIGYIDDGQSSKRIVDFLIEKMEGK